MIDSHALVTLGLIPPTRLFEGFPYLVTRIVPTLYHIILLPDDASTENLLETARRQAHANRLRTCLVLWADSALYLEPDGREPWRASPPTGGVIVTDRLRPCRTFPETESFVRRRLALKSFIEQVAVKTGYMFGDLTKGGRPATLEETVMLAGMQPNGVPRGL